MSAKEVIKNDYYKLIKIYYYLTKKKQIYFRFTSLIKEELQLKTEKSFLKFYYS